MVVNHRSWEWLLALQLSWASIIPLLICLSQYSSSLDIFGVFILTSKLSASVALTSRVAALFGLDQRAWVERVQKRVAVTAGMLGDMKVVKMLGLSAVV